MAPSPALRPPPARLASAKVVDSTAGTALTQTTNCSITITPPGKIIINKVTNPSTDTTTTFSYSTTGTGYAGSFTLLNGGTNTSGSLSAGSYSVTEQNKTGWTLIGVTCTATAGSSATVNGSTVNITLATGGTVTCTYTNGQTGVFCSYTARRLGSAPEREQCGNAVGQLLPRAVPERRADRRCQTVLRDHAHQRRRGTELLAQRRHARRPRKQLQKPTSTEAGEFGSQVSALQFNVDFSNQGLIKPGFSTAKVVSGPLAGLTMTQVLALAEAALSGNTSVLTPYGITVAQLTTMLGNYNGNYDGRVDNNGFLK